MSTITKSEILRIFKALHRACRKTFRGDEEILTGMRKDINNFFKESKAETDSEKIRKLYNDAVAIENEIRTKILQVEHLETGRNRVRIEPEHCFKDPPKRKRCCDDQEHSKSEKASADIA